jgi:sugar/nucleoside kinase (ribokinase family)
MCYDEIVQPGGQRTVTPGSAVLCGALAAARVGKKVAVITRMSPNDEHMLSPMKDAGIATHIIPTADTTYMRVVYPGTDVDRREITQLHSAGLFAPADLPKLQTAFLHLAAITDQEFTADFVRDLSGGSFELSLDVQSFLRRVDPATGGITLSTVPELKSVFRYCTRLKLDIVEARLLTLAENIWDAARMLADWGCPELVITEARGVLAQAGGCQYYENFTNQNSSGRTGRGDTTFAGYLAWRQEHGIPEALRFAAALASIKMETPGPFAGNIQDVFTRMGR